MITQSLICYYLWSVLWALCDVSYKKKYYCAICIIKQSNTSLKMCEVREWSGEVFSSPRLPAYRLLHFHTVFCCCVFNLCWCAQVASENSLCDCRLEHDISREEKNLFLHSSKWWASSSSPSPSLQYCLPLFVFMPGHFLPKIPTAHQWHSRAGSALGIWCWLRASTSFLSLCERKEWDSADQSWTSKIKEVPC